MDPQIGYLAAAGLVGGLWLLARGMGGYRTATRLGDTGTSTIASMAAGEVRLSGTIEPAEVTLVSPLQSRRCVFYRAVVREQGEGGGRATTEERAVGFRVRDATGDVRVFPRGARFDAPVRFEEETGQFGDEPPGLALRSGPAVAQGQPDRDAQVAALLTVRRAPDEGGVLSRLQRSDRRRRRYQEARLEPGDAVTIVGRALPFSDLADPIEADEAIGGTVGADDPEVAADLAEARAAGLLADDPAQAWGNAAIPGFGIGRPVEPPELHPEADRPVLAEAAAAERAERIFEIEPERLVLAAGRDVSLLIVHGAPGAAVDRHQDRFAVGLLGAVLAIGSAMVLAVMLGGGFGS